MKSRRLRNVISLGLVVAGVALAGCSSKSEGPKTYTGEEITMGMMGIGPTAERWGGASTLKERLDKTRNDLKMSAISVDVLQQNAADLAPQSGDPLPPTRLAGRMPTGVELTNLSSQLDTVQIPSEQQYQTLVNYVISEIKRRAPNYFETFASEMQSGDAARVNAAVKQMKRTLVSVFESDALATITKNDPSLATVTTQDTGGGTGSGTGSGGGDPGAAGPNTNPMNPPADPMANKSIDPVVVPNQLPNKDNTYKWDQYAVGTRAAVGAYVGAAVALAVGVVVWAVAVKGLGPFIPFANAQDQNPGDPLAEELSVAKLTKNFAH
jgi:hypothetical protein